MTVSGVESGNVRSTLTIRKVELASAGNYSCQPSMVSHHCNQSNALLSFTSSHTNKNRQDWSQVRGDEVIVRVKKRPAGAPEPVTNSVDSLNIIFFSSSLSFLPYLSSLSFLSLYSLSFSSSSVFLFFFFSISARLEILQSH